MVENLALLWKVFACFSKPRSHDFLVECSVRLEKRSKELRDVASDRSWVVSPVVLSQAYGEGLLVDLKGRPTFLSEHREQSLLTIDPQTSTPLLHLKMVHSAELEVVDPAGPVAVILDNGSAASSWTGQDTVASAWPGDPAESAMDVSSAVRHPARDLCLLPELHQDPAICRTQGHSEQQQPLAVQEFHDKTAEQMTVHRGSTLPWSWGTLPEARYLATAPGDTCPSVAPASRRAEVQPVGTLWAGHWPDAFCQDVSCDTNSV